ncbi:MAG: 50S ribosomal protein L4 [Armatimonadota bacterium]
MPSAPLFNAAGDKVGDFSLAEGIFGQAVRVDLVHQAVTRELWNRVQGTRSTKGRSEVRGGGRKPYRQKGTGRARQGSIRAPHYRHGGIVHGPVPHAPEKDMPQKMRRAAFRSALSAKAADGDVRVLEGLEVAEISTKQFAQWLTRLEPGRKAVVVLAERDQNVALSARNLPNVRVVVLPGLSTYEVVKADTLIFTRDAVARLEELYTA